MVKPIFLSAVAVAVLAGAVTLVYSRGLGSPFIFDDDTSVIKNSSITELWPLLGNSEHVGPLNPPAETPTSGRPLVNYSLALNYHFDRLNPVGYHVFNLVVHVLSAILLMAMVRRILRLDCFQGRFARASGGLAFLVSLLWALHPLQTETVVYVTQRTELMVGFFYLATLYASLRYWEVSSPASRSVWLALAASACLAGMACKEVMVTAPVVVLLFERTFLTGTFRQALKKSWPLYSGLALSWVLLVWLHRHGPRSTTAGFDLGLNAGTWWLTQTKVLWIYFKLVVWPWPQAIHYEVPYLTTFGAAWPWAVSTSLLAIGALVLLWRHNAAGFVLACVLLILSPTLIVPIITETAAERRMYLPLAAFITLGVAGAYRLIDGAFKQPAPAASNRTTTASGRAASLKLLAGISATLLAAMLGAASFHRLKVYHDELALWQDVLASQPSDHLAHYNLGNCLSRLDRIAEAAEQFQQAVQLAPGYVAAHNNLGLALGKLGNALAALEQFQQAVQFQPTFTEAWANMALAQAALNHPAEAVAMAQKAIELARSQGQTKLAGEVEAWLTNYRAPQGGDSEQSQRPAPLQPSP